MRPKASCKPSRSLRKHPPHMCSGLSSLFFIILVSLLLMAFLIPLHAYYLRILSYHYRRIVLKIQYVVYIICACILGTKNCSQGPIEGLGFQRIGAMVRSVVSANQPPLLRLINRGAALLCIKYRLSAKVLPLLAV